MAVLECPCCGELCPHEWGCNCTAEKCPECLCCPEHCECDEEPRDGS